VGRRSLADSLYPKNCDISSRYDDRWLIKKTTLTGSFPFNIMIKEQQWHIQPYSRQVQRFVILPNAVNYAKFYSPFISSAQRLPNGNTLITEGSDGRIIEVTAGHEIVWEYIGPYWGRHEHEHALSCLSNSV
jgi:hypothetical protein